MPMSLTLTVDDPDAVLNAGEYGSGALLRLQWSATQAGTYVDVSGTGSTPSVPVVSGQRSYPAYDPAGTTTTWYRTRFENAGGTRLSAWSPAFRVGGPSGAYASAALFRAFIRDQAPAATAADGDLELVALEAAARAIDRECGRDFTLATGTATARVFTAGISTESGAWRAYRFAVDVDDFFDATGLTVAFDATGNGSYTNPCTAFRAMPINAPAHGRPYDALLFDIGVLPALNPYGVQVTANWGWDAYPSAVINANLIQAARFMKRRDSPFGIAGSPEMGNELRLLAKLDPDVALLLRAYKLDWGNQ